MILRSCLATPPVTVKLLVLVAVPPGVVTAMGPVVAAVGTVAVICVFELTVNVVAVVPLNFTAVAPVKPVPVITTEVPTGPLVGLNDVIVGIGDAVTSKLVALVAVPPGVVTAMGPSVAPLGTVAVICVFEFTVKVAAVPLNFTALAPVKPVPVITTDVPTGPLVGLNDVIVGAGDGVTSKLVALVAVPSESVTAIGPSVAPAGTVAVIWTLESTVNVAAVPLKVTAEATLESWKPVPLIWTDVPIGPLVGLNDVTVGAAANAVSTVGMVTASAAIIRTAETRAAPRLTDLSMSISPLFHWISDSQSRVPTAASGKQT